MSSFSSTPSFLEAHKQSIGYLALAYAGRRLPLRVCKSAVDYYLGTFCEEGPCSRESVEYFFTREAAQRALASGQWTQRLAP